MPKALIKRIGTKVNGTEVETMVTTIVRVIMFEKEITTTTTTSTWVTMVIEMGPMFLLKIVKLLLGMVEVVWRELRICFTK